MSRPLGEASRNEDVRERRWKAPGILNLSSAERLANFKFWPLYRQENSLRYPLDRWPGGCQNQPKRSSEAKKKHEHSYLRIVSSTHFVFMNLKIKNDDYIQHHPLNSPPSWSFPCYVLFWSGHIDYIIN